MGHLALNGRYYKLGVVNTGNRFVLFSYRYACPGKYAKRLREAPRLPAREVHRNPLTCLAEACYRTMLNVKAQSLRQEPMISCSSVCCKSIQSTEEQVSILSSHEQPARTTTNMYLYIPEIQHDAGKIATALQHLYKRSV